LCFINRTRENMKRQQQEPPTNKQGLTTGQTLQAAEEMGKFSKEDAGYVESAEQASVTCGTCRFYQRGQGEVGLCQVVEGDITWRATSDLYISAEAEAVATFAQANDYTGEDEEERMATPIQRLWGRVKAIFDPYLVERRIKEVEEWDGSPSRWPDTEAYCADCLIDVNGAAGREEKAQSHCLLPVREPGDSQDTLVAQAVFAAAGGRGLSRVEKLEDVPQEAWDAAVRGAANKLIGAYEEMDRVAPAGIFEAAGKEPPEAAERAMSISEVYNAVAGKLQELEGDGLLNKFANLMDVFSGPNEMYAIVAQEGKLLRMDISITEQDDLLLSVPRPVKVEFIPTGRCTVKRQADGKYRITSVACTAILNRDGEIDTTELFDDFIARIDSGKAEYPELDFFHVDGLEIGKCDFIARDGYALITSGVFYEDDFSQKVARGLEASGEKWGQSITFFPYKSEEMNVSGVKIRANTRGVLHKVAVLPEDKAAALFTSVKTKTRGKNMNKDIMEALRDLGLTEDEIEEQAQRADGINRAVDSEGMVARHDHAPTQGSPELPDGVLKLREQVADNQARLDSIQSVFKEAMQPIVAGMQELGARLAALEQADEERKRAWLAEVPPPVYTTATHRPRETRKSTSEATYSQIAAETMRNAGLGK
jgi:hypothetical protein